MASQSCAGLQAGLSWDTGCGKKSTPMQSDPGGLSRRRSPRRGSIGGVRSDLQGEMGKNAGDPREVADGFVGLKPNTLLQGVVEQSRFPGVRDLDLPSHGSLFEGLSPHHRDLAWRPRPRGVEFESKGRFHSR